MERPASELVLQRLAAVCPLSGVASRLEARMGPLLSSAEVYVSPRLYSRFLVSVLVLPAPAEAAALILLPLQQAGLIVGSLLLLQAMPVVVLLSRRNSRRRASEAELPFFLMTLSVFVHESNPSLQAGFRRIASVGASVFPAFVREAQILARDDAFVPGSPMGVAERAFEAHPSARVRSFVKGFLKTLATGRDISEFVRSETSFQVQKLEQSWASFSSSVASLAEVTFIVLALFPVGLEMVGATVSGFTSSPLFLASFALLAVAAVVFLVLSDSLQPVVYDRPPAAFWLALSLSGWLAATLAFAAGLVGSREYVLIPLALSAAGFLRTRKHSSRVRKGEEEVGALLHELAEQTRAGVSLPEALSKVASEADSFPSTKEALLAFHQGTRLGLTPTEAQKRVDHPSWLVRLGFGVLSVAFETGAGFEHLEDLSSLFRRVAEARKSVAQSMVPFVLIGAVVPVISVASITFLAGFSQQGAPIGLPLFAVQTSKVSLVLSVSAVSALSGVLLSKILTQTVRHQVALPILMASTLVALFAFGVA